jgi:hypothetical protein
LADLSPDRVFDIHPKIRWVGLATDAGDVVFSKMRPGVQSLSPGTFDQSFVQLGALLLAGVCERLAPWAGPLETVVSSYEKVIMLVTKLKKRYLALTLDKEDAGILSELISSPSQLEVAA